MDTLSDIFIRETDLFCSLCCDIFLPFHAGVVLIVEFGWKVEVDVWQVGKQMPNVLNRLGTIHPCIAPLYHRNWVWYMVGSLFFIWHPPHNGRWYIRSLIDTQTYKGLFHILFHSPLVNSNRDIGRPSIHTGNCALDWRSQQWPLFCKVRSGEF